jgi:hypothetical protein
MNIDPTGVSRLLETLCVELGFCLSPIEQQRLLANPPADIDAFTQAVFAAEGMDQRLHRQLYRQVRERLAQAFGTLPRGSVIGEMPDDWWHTWVFVNFSWLACLSCDLRPDTDWAWNDLPPDEDAAIVATKRIVPRLISEGWEMHDQIMLCPDCAHRLRED